MTGLRPLSPATELKTTSVPTGFGPVQAYSFVYNPLQHDSGAKSWTEKKPALLPPCVNEGMMEYDTTRNIVVYTGGTCATSLSTDETYEWNGVDNWVKIDLNSGEHVKIKEGPFENFDGVVDETFPAKGTVRVIVTIFGRATPVELEYWQVEKI